MRETITGADQIRDDTRRAMRETIDADETAAITGLSTWVIYDLARKKKIPHIRVGRRVLFRRSSIVAWLEELERASVQREELQTGKIRRLK